MEMLKTKGTDLKGKTVLISGSGNVAQYTAEKVLQLGGKVLTMSDSDGYIYDPDGIDREKLDYIMELKNLYRGRIREYAEKYGCKYVAGARPWGEKADIALPSATQNEINGDQARQLVANGVMAVSEGANMPSTPEAIRVFQEAKILYAPGKAANAGGVSVSGLEMSQNSERLSWTSEEVDARLHAIMENIHQNCVKYGTEADGYVNYVKGAKHRRFHEGSQGYDGSRYRIRFNHRIHKGTEECLHSLRPFSLSVFLPADAPKPDDYPFGCHSAVPRPGTKKPFKSAPSRFRSRTLRSSPPAYPVKLP